MRIIKFIATILIVLLQLFGTSRSLDASVTERMVQKKKCYSQKLEAVLKNTDKLSLSYFKNANKGILDYGKKASPECFEAYYPIYETQQILALQQLSSMYKLDDPAHSESRCVPEWRSSSADRLKFDALKAEFLAAGITLVFKNAEGGARCMAYFTKGWHTETFGHLFNDAWNQYYRITNPLVGRPLFQDAGVSISYSDLAKHILAIDKFLIDYPKFPLIYRQTKNSENIKINWEDIHTLDLDKRFSAFFDFFLQSYDNSRVFKSDHENKRYYLPNDGRYTNSQIVMMNLFSKVQNKSLKKTLMDFYAYLEANDFKFNWGTVRGTVNNEIDQFFQGYEPFILNYDVPSRARDIQTVKKDALISYLSNDKISIKDIPRAYWADRDFVSKVIKHDAVAIRFASERIRSDATFCAPLLDKNPYLLSYLSDTLKSNRDIVLAAVKRNGYVLKFVSKPLRNDADIVREAVKDSPSSFEYASNEIRNNEAFVLALLDEVQSSYYRRLMLKYISNLNILFKVIKKDPHGLNYLSNEFRNNRELALVALSQNGSVLKDVSNELKDDKELVLAALNAENYSVTYKRELLSYASRRLQNDASLLRELD